MQVIRSINKPIISGFWQLRNDLIKQLVTQEIKNFKFMDFRCTTARKPTANNLERLAELRKVTAKDGVHFVDAGYKNPWLVGVSVAYNS
jgi:hypothetical protein